MNHLKAAENNNTGRRGGKWYQYPSYEGGTDTIAWGDKLKPGEDFRNGLTDAQAHALLVSDFENALRIARTHYSQVYPGGWENLSPYVKIIAADIAFNTGNLSGYPKFMRAMRENNLNAMKQECCSRSGNKPLTNRNKMRQNYLQDNLG